MTIYGPDASKWQGDVSWGPVDRVAEFGWEKATEGPGKGVPNGYVSERWGPEKPEMAARAAASGFIPGAYLFLAEGDGARQADWFADHVGPGMDGFAIAVDVEPRDATGSHPTEQQARACVARLRARYPGHPIGGYIPAWYWGNKPVTFTDYLWESHYVTGGPASPQALYAKVPAAWWGGHGGLPVSLLQFTDKALVPGVSGPCDCSAYRGTPAALRALVLPGKTAAAKPKEPAVAPLRRVWIPSPNYTSPRREATRLIVLHTTEGAQSYQSLGSFFGNPASQVSSHVGIDDTPGTVGEYVKRGSAAWTASGANHAAVQAEFCTPSGAADGWSRATWMNQHAQMLRNAAAWIAEESRAFGIPIVSLSPAQAQGGGRGVCQHSDLGAWGGGHHDCGPGFPMDYVISLARGGLTQAPAKPVFLYNPQEETMQVVFDKGAEGEAPAASIPLGNQYSGGKHKARFSSRRPATLRVDFGSGVKPVTLTDAFTPVSVDIPDGKRVMVVKLDTGGDAAVYLAISDK